MSHVAYVKLQIKDLDALEVACKEVGLELVRGQETYKWYGKWEDDYNAPESAVQNGFDPRLYGKCEHAIRVPGNGRAYEIGVVRDPASNALTLVYDNWQQGYGLEQVAGEGLSKLKQSYAATVAYKQMVKMGCRVMKSVVNGKVVLTGSKL